MATTGPVDVHVDTGELGRLRSELQALSQQLVWAESQLAHPDQDLGGQVVATVLAEFFTRSRTGRDEFRTQLERAASFVGAAIDGYEHVEADVRAKVGGCRVIGVDWSVLGGDPTPGDPVVLRGFADRIRMIEETSRAVADRMNALGSAVDRHIWAGPAADAFVHSMLGLAPMALTFVNGHTDAVAAITSFVNVLEHAKDVAAQALAAALSATERAASAERDRVAGTSAAATAVSAREAAKQRLAQADALAATATDPVYLAQLKQYKAEVFRAFSAALSQENAANQRVQAAQVAADEARQALDAARQLADEARALHSAAVRALEQRMREGISWLSRWDHFQSVVSTLFDLPGKLVLLHKFTNLRYGRWWSLLHKFDDYPKLKKFFQYKRSPVLKWFEKHPGLRNLDENPVFKKVTRGFTILSDGVSIAQHLRDHDGIGLFNDGSDIVTQAIPTKNPTTFLVKLNISIWSHVVTEASKIDWHDMPTLQEIRDYGPSSLREAILPTTKIVRDSVLESL